jgi:SAM-dependent methyltransferase
MMDSDPEGFIRYLAAKQSVDDRSLNRHVWQVLKTSLPAPQAATALQVLEVGGGIGTMFERSLKWGLCPHFDYVLVDQHAEYLSAVQSRATAMDGGHGNTLDWQTSGRATFNFQGQRGSLRTLCADVYSLFSDAAGRNRWDLIIAHAFMDLVDIAEVLDGIRTLLKPEGLLYFTINYDGLMDFLPVFDRRFERQIHERYHHSMDHRLVRGRVSGSSQAGRVLLSLLQAGEYTLLAAGSSDWMVYPLAHRYPGDEAFFLEAIIQTIYDQLKTDSHLNQPRLEAWKECRQAQIQAAELIYRAHNVDVLARRADDGA